MKTAIIVMSDPESAGDEAFGRVFNALAAAGELKAAGDDVTLVFQGTGTRWPRLLSQTDHAAHGLYQAVKDRVAGASAGCAVAFGAKEDVEQAGLELLGDNPVPGTPGLASLAQLAIQGYRLLTF